MSRHVPAMSPDPFGDTVRITDNVLVKHKRRAAILMYYFSTKEFIRLDCS